MSSSDVEENAEKWADAEIDVPIIPAATASSLKPLNVAIIKPFKAKFYELIHA